MSGIRVGVSMVPCIVAVSSGVSVCGIVVGCGGVSGETAWMVSVQSAEVSLSPSVTALRGVCEGVVRGADVKVHVVACDPAPVLRSGAVGESVDVCWWKSVPCPGRNLPGISVE